MESKGFKIGDCARDMMGQKAFTTLIEPVEIRLVRPTVAELGFKKGAITRNVWKRAKDLGLKRCPAEVGPHLRLADVDQTNGEWYWIGMVPITDADGCPNMFRVGHGVDGRWLNGFGARPDYLWAPGGSIVFVAAGK